MNMDEELRLLVRAIGPDAAATHLQLQCFLRALGDEDAFCAFEDDDYANSEAGKLIEVATAELRLIARRDPPLPEIEAQPLPMLGHLPGSTVAKPIVEEEQA